MPGSDHMYVILATSALPPPRAPRARRQPPRWALNQLDAGAAQMASSVVAWASFAGRRPRRPRYCALWLQPRCKLFATPQCRGPGCRLRVGGRLYWWSSEIADLRAVSLRHDASTPRPAVGIDGGSRRAGFQELRAAFRAAHRELCEAIARAKTRSCDEFLAILNEDPWGRPYRTVSIKPDPGRPLSQRASNLGFSSTSCRRCFPLPRFQGPVAPMSRETGN